MSQSISTTTLVNKWQNMEKCQQAVLLIGYHHTGRSTFAELISRDIFGCVDPELKFDNGKYNLENVISTKSIKIQTTTPRTYRGKDDVAVIDVPCLILPPQVKKWTNFDQKISLTYLQQRTERVGFLIFVEEKQTRTNVTLWKKAVLSFLELFDSNQIHQDFFESVGMIVTKAPSDLQTDTMLKRLEKLKQNLQKEVESQLLNKLFNRIIQKERLFIFKKVTGDDLQKKQMIQNWGKLSQMVNYHLNKHPMKQIIWSEQQQKSISDYVLSVEPCVEYLIGASRQIIEKQRYQPQKLTSLKQLFPQNIKLQQVEAFGTAKSINFNKLSVVQLIQKYLNLEKQMMSLNQKIYTEQLAKNLLLLLELCLFEKEQEVFQIFQLIQDALNFRQITQQKISYSGSLQLFQQLFTHQIKQKIFGWLNDSQFQDGTHQFYQTIIDLISQNFEETPQNLKNVLENAKQRVMSSSDPSQALKHLSRSLEKEKEPKKQFKTILKLAQLVKSRFFFEESLILFKGIGCPNEAIDCYKFLAQKNQNYAKQMILYQVQTGLFSQAKSACFSAASRFGFQYRYEYGELLNQVLRAEKQFFSGNTFPNVLLAEINFQKLIERAKQIVIEVSEKTRNL